jgi:hypothetical protein
VRHKGGASTVGIGPAAHNRKTTMLKSIIAALIVASAASAFVSKAYAGPTGQIATPYYMERASANHDNGDSGSN